MTLAAGELDAAAIAEVARRLSMAGEAIGARVRVGTCDHYQSCGYLFAIINHRGEPLTLAHDAFEAALWFVRYETQEEWKKWEDDAHPMVSLPSDVDLEANAFAQRKTSHRRSRTWAMIDINRINRTPSRRDLAQRPRRQSITALFGSLIRGYARSEAQS